MLTAEMRELFDSMWRAQSDVEWQVSKDRYWTSWLAEMCDCRLDVAGEQLELFKRCGGNGAQSGSLWQTLQMVKGWYDWNGVGWLEGVPVRWSEVKRRGRQAVFHRQSMLQVVRASGLVFRQQGVSLPCLVKQGECVFPDAAMALQLLEELVLVCGRWMAECEAWMQGDVAMGRCGMVFVGVFWEYHVMKIRPLRDGNRRFAAVMRQACWDGVVSLPIGRLDDLVLQTVLESGGVEDLFVAYVGQMKKMVPLRPVLQTVFVKTVEDWVKAGGERSVWDGAAIGDDLVGPVGWRMVKWHVWE
jgi:hypothetical protein